MNMSGSDVSEASGTTADKPGGVEDTEGRKEVYQGSGAAES